jgi:hypothetical protein|nr:MAG TPA: hypothetical protein [Bacteriophage sp.]
MIEKEIKQGDILSESSHYKVKSILGSSVILEHFESKNEVAIDKGYLTNFCSTADGYTTEVKVTKEDKKDGTLGIRSIWENIHSSKVFTVCFKKQDKAKSQKKLNEEIDYLVKQFSADIDKVKANKKGVAERAKKLITELIREPILPYEEGEDRVLRGFKIQFESRDGKYQCIDMDIEDSENNVRLVNINTIKWLIIDNTKYIVQ